MAQPIRIDIVSDVVCPWCAVGYGQLRLALEETETVAEIAWRPFELNPDMPPEGQDLDEHIAQKYGSSAEDSAKARARLTETGAALGFTFNYADGMRMVNTFQAHQLIHWAGTHGSAHRMKMALLAAYFTHRRDVSDPAVLAEMAGEIGLDTAEAADALAEARFAEAVRTEQQFWVSRGIHAVPTMVFQNRYAATGARGIPAYREILTRLSQATAAA